MTLAADVASFFDEQEAPQRTVPDPSGRQTPFAATRSELQGYMAEMKDLRYADPDEAMAWLSSVSARALEMRSWTLENDSRHATKFRIEELIPFSEECRFQFQVASRRFSVLEQEWKLAGGQAT